MGSSSKVRCAALSRFSPMVSVAVYKLNALDICVSSLGCLLSGGSQGFVPDRSGDLAYQWRGAAGHY